MQDETVRIWRGTLAGFVAFGVSLFVLRPAGELCAVIIRRQWPEAWFSGLIVSYADFFAVGFSFVLAVLVRRYTLKRAARS
jgi:hypothetical protein